MRPRVLHVRGQHDRALLGERGLLHVEVIERERRPDARVEYGFVRHRLTPGSTRRGDCTGEKRGERPAVDHDHASPADGRSILRQLIVPAYSLRRTTLARLALMAAMNLIGAVLRGDGWAQAASDVYGWIATAAGATASAIAGSSAGASSSLCDR